MHLHHFLLLAVTGGCVWVMILQRQLRRQNERLRQLSSRLEAIQTSIDTEQTRDPEAVSEPVEDEVVKGLTPESVAALVSKQIAIIPPPLKRILYPSVRFTIEFARTVMGLTDTDLATLKRCTGGQWIGIGVGLRIEEWETHLVAIRQTAHNHEERLLTIFNHDHNWACPYILWEQGLESQPDAWSGSSLELVIQDRTIRFWIRGGQRFPAQEWDGLACPEGTFAAIPMNIAALEQYRVPDDPDQDGERAYKSTSWSSWYQHCDPRGFEWNLGYDDVVVFAAEA